MNRPSRGVLVRTWGMLTLALLVTHCTNDPGLDGDARTVPAECEHAACLEMWACKEALWWYDYDISGFTCSGDRLMACHDVHAPIPANCCAKECECELVRTCAAGCEQNFIGTPCCIEDDTCVHGLGTQQPCCDGQGICRNPDSLRADVRIDLLVDEAIQDSCMDGEICFPSWFADHPQTSDLVGPWPACVPTSTPGTTEEGRCVPECSRTTQHRMWVLETQPDYQDFPPIAQDDCAPGLVCIPCAYTIRGKERETYVCNLPPLE